MISDNDDNHLQVPDPLLTKVRRLNSWLKGIDNPAMTPVQDGVSKDQTTTVQQNEQDKIQEIQIRKDHAATRGVVNSATITKNKATDSSSSWVFTPTKDHPDFKPGNKNFHESWSNIERYLQQRRPEPFVRKRRCPCITRKCRFVMGVGLLAALVMALIIVIVHFVIMSKKDHAHLNSLQTKQEPALTTMSYYDEELESLLLESEFNSSDLHNESITTNQPKVTTTGSSGPTTSTTIIPLFLGTDSTETQQPNTTWMSTVVPATNTPNPDLLIDLLLLPGPLQRFSKDPAN